MAKNCKLMPLLFELNRGLFHPVILLLKLKDGFVDFVHAFIMIGDFLILVGVLLYVFSVDLLPVTVALFPVGINISLDNGIILINCFHLIGGGTDSPIN